MTLRLAKIASIGVALGMALAATNPARAAVTITSAGIDSQFGSQTGTISYTPSSGQSVNENGLVGEITLSGTDAKGNSASWESFCVDIYNYLGTGAFQAQNISTLGLSAPKVSQLNALLSNGLSYITDSTTSAAMQMAIWEVVYEPGTTNYDVSSGTFSVSGVSSDAVNDANYALSMVANGTWKTTPTFALAVFTAQGKQSQLVYSNGGSQSFADSIGMVPEPSTWGMMILGFGFLGVAMRRDRAALKTSPNGF